ncbi:MAG: hypothetical protein H6831_04645 [Planctomycetes bacterium]|nr:hypothetical protein [Planctomycetota bacterium]MCB9903677.1 hypothetical protein [Planctomycetota bacterium]
MHFPTPFARAVTHRFQAAAALVVAVLALLAVPGCDNVACVFGEGGCIDRNTSGGLGSQSATQLRTGDWTQPTAPSVVRFLPTADAHPSTPIVLEFSESMNADSLDGAFEIMEVDGFAAIPLNATLTGDGRLAILTGLPLTEGTSYEVLYAEDGQAYDRTGQTLRAPTDRILGTFTVSSSPPVQPRLIASFPADASTGASAITTIVAVFDRPLQTTTVNATTFRVTVEGAAPPTNTGPLPLQVSNGSGGFVPEPRVFTWRAQNALGDRLPLGNQARVDLALSNDGGGPTIKDNDGGVMAARTVGFTTATTPPPSAAQILSTPTDAIGIANLDGTTPLSLQVDLALPAAAGDVLEIYLVGRDLQPDSEGLPRNNALLRTFPLSDGTVTVLLGEAELMLAASLAPVSGVFQDGSVNIAFAQVASGVRTPVRVLDVDPTGSAKVDPVLDTTAPKLLSLGHYGDQISEYRSDLRDLVVNGVSDEELRSVEVRAQIGLVQYTNGTLPDVASYDAATGAFIARTAPLGVIDVMDLPATAMITLYDKALNAAPVAVVPFTQLGASGPGAALPGPDVTVTVFDASTLLPVAGALVLTHQDDGGVYTAVATATTDVQGRATLSSATVGETIVSVDGAGYDLFSFHGVPTSRLDVPLHLSTIATSVVNTGIFADYEEISLLENGVVDSRVPFPLDPRQDATSCFFNPFTEETACTFSPYPVSSRRLGALVQLSTLTPAAENVYSAESFLRGFGWFTPRPGLEPGSPEFVELVAGSLLSDISTPAEDRAIDAPAQSLALAGAVGVDLGNLTGAPVATIEALAPGLPDAPQVGAALGFDQGGNVWNLRGAYPGAVDGILSGGGDQLGSLVESDAIERDLFFGAEITDTSGNRSGVRSRFSFLSGSLALSAVPTISAPVANTGGPSFDLDFADVIPDALGRPGLYQATIADGTGRSWRAWRLDPPDSNGPTVTIHLPDIALGGGVPLADGALAATVAAYALPDTPGSLTYGGFDPTEFLWTDVQRQWDRRSVSAPVLFSQP